MKKILFAVAAIVAMSFAACGESTKAGGVEDSVAVEDSVVDSLVVEDSVGAAVDTVFVECE